IASLQMRYAKYVLSSTTPGIVSENRVKVGDHIDPGQPITSVLQLRLRADFSMPRADAAALKTGMIARLQRTSDSKLVDCRIEKIDDDENGQDSTVRVEVMDVASGLQARDSVRLVRALYPQIVRLPAQVIVRP